MAVKVGNSWVSEAAYAYAKARQEEPKTGDGMLSQLSEKYPGTDFSTNTEPFSGKGTRNIAIAPNILKEMEQDPDKRLEYEALVYDCVSLQKTLPDTFRQNGSKLQAFGFIIDSKGGLSAWSISQPIGTKGKAASQCRLPRQDKGSWMSRILPKQKGTQMKARKAKGQGRTLDVRA